MRGVHLLLLVVFRWPVLGGGSGSFACVGVLVMCRRLWVDPMISYSRFTRDLYVLV